MAKVEGFKEDRAGRLLSALQSGDGRRLSQQDVEVVVLTDDDQDLPRSLHPIC